MNKIQVVEQMVHLEKLAAENPAKAAECYFQLANAWYNMTWHGKNWLMVKQWWSRGELYFNDDLRGREVFNRDYYGCNKAKEYYLKAIQHTKDKNLASLSCMMAGVCEKYYQKFLWCLSNPKNDWDMYEGEFTNPYTARLKKKGMNDKVYEKLINECALYNDFIGKYNKKL